MPNSEVCLRAFEVVPVSVPLKTSFSITGSTQTSYFGCFVKLTDGAGRVGVGECCPLLGATADTLPENLRFLPERSAQCIGLSVDGALELLDDEWMRDYGHHFNAGLCCLEMALLDLKCQQIGVSLAELMCRLSGNKTNHFEVPLDIECDITVPAISLIETERFLKSVGGFGFKSFKVKVTGENIAADFERVKLTHGLMPRGSQLTLDGNQGFSAQNALSLIELLQVQGIDVSLFEQPHPKNDWATFVDLATQLPFPICLDESVKNRKDLEQALSYGVPFWLNLKIMKSGIRESYLLGLQAKELGIPLMIGGMVESDVAMTCSLHVLKALGGVDIVDLDTPFFMKELISENTAYHKASSSLCVPEGLGLGLIYSQKYLGESRIKTV